MLKIEYVARRVMPERWYGRVRSRAQDVLGDMAVMCDAEALRMPLFNTRENLPRLTYVQALDLKDRKDARPAGGNDRNTSLQPARVLARAGMIVMDLGPSQLLTRQRRELANMIGEVAALETRLGKGEPFYGVLLGCLGGTPSQPELDISEVFQGGFMPRSVTVGGVAIGMTINEGGEVMEI